MSTSFERAAIIGYYRSGATLNEIVDIMEKSVDEVSKIIFDYLNHNK